MNRFVRLSHLAEDDILRNAIWWADHHSVDEAIEWESVVRRQLQQIAIQPESHGLSLELQLSTHVIREALVGKGKRGSYRAVFAVAGDTIVVLRILRASQGEISPEDLPEEFC